MENTKPVSVPQGRLHRIALGADDIGSRHADKPVIAAAYKPLKPVAAEFVAAHDSVEPLRMAQTKRVAESGEATAALDHKNAEWVGPLARDLPGFDPTSYGQHPEVALEVIADGRRLIQVVEVHAGDIEYADQILQSLRPSLELAQAAHARAQAARSALQRQQAEVRRLAALLQPHLIAMRRALRSTLGTNDHDYQRLRASRTAADDAVVEVEADDDADDAVEAAQPGTVVAAE